MVDSVGSLDVGFAFVDAVIDDCVDWTIVDAAKCVTPGKIENFKMNFQSNSYPCQWLTIQCFYTNRWLTVCLSIASVLA